MLDQITYPLNVSLIRMNLTSSSDTGGVAGPRRTTSEYGLHELVQTPSKVTLIFNLKNLYIEGFYNKEKKVFLTSNSKYSVAPHVRLPYGYEYGDLGFNRNAGHAIDLGDVNGALANLYHATRATRPNDLKRSLWISCIAFAEAARFDDILLGILGKKPIGDLDWSKRVREGGAQVRVVQS